MEKLLILKELRDRTNVSLGECKSAFEEASWNLEQAAVVLQKRGAVGALSKATKETNEGRMWSYVHNNGKLAVLVEVNCQTDFAAKSPQFEEYCEQVALQIAAMDPKYLSTNAIPESDLSKQKEILMAQVPAKVPENKKQFVLDGKVKRWLSEVCLMEQTSVVVAEKTMEQLRTDLVSKLGENVVVRRFVRFEVGEKL